MRRLLHSAAIAAILGLGALTTIPPAPAHANVVVGVSVGFPPPPLPYYDQPPIPGPGYIWTPGYWAWDGFDYYWSPGIWVLAPEPGFLWTPAFWGWDDGVYLFHAGYWGLSVGFYGGIDYGFGYGGFGYDGGYWDRGRFFYNRTVNNISNANITNVYNRPVNDPRVNRVSFNGGPGGLTARPTASQTAAGRAFHVLPTRVQQQNQRAAAAMPSLHASANHGVPPIAATARAGVLRGPGVIPASRTAPYNGPTSRSAALGAGQRGARGTMTTATAGTAARGQATSTFASRPANRLAAPARAAQTMARQTTTRPGSARSASRYGVPASAETFRAPAARQNPYASSRAYSGYRQGATTYHAPQQQAFRAAPRMAAPSFQARSAPSFQARAAPSRPAPAHENNRGKPGR